MNKLAVAKVAGVFLAGAVVIALFVLGFVVWGPAFGIFLMCIVYAVGAYYLLKPVAINLYKRFDNRR